MALAQVLKIFTKERLFYQHLNNQNQHFVDRINERLESSEVSATKAANKVPRANASGQLEYDLKGLADAAKGDTRFWVSGCIGGDPGLTYSIPSATERAIQFIYRSIPSGKVLKLKRANYCFVSLVTLIMRTDSDPDPKFIRVIVDEDATFDVILAEEGDHRIKISLFNSDIKPITLYPYDSWWFEFAIE